MASKPKRVPRSRVVAKSPKASPVIDRSLAIEGLKLRLALEIDLTHRLIPGCYGKRRKKLIAVAYLLQDAYQTLEE